mmetsp:Transcript_7891/g.13230  ORF Transcript_7891/g.13230 Transcript_7891/m.13230 type:complete len:90 (+) Transcript_7891:36-305(+)
MFKKDVIMISGCGGQVGKKLIERLQAILHPEQIVATDLQSEKPAHVGASPYFQLDVRDEKTYRKIVEERKVTKIIHMAAIISALGEKHT